MTHNFDELYRAVKREGIKEDNQIDGVSMVGVPQIMNLDGTKKKKSKNPYLVEVVMKTHKTKLMLSCEKVIVK